MPAAWTGCGGDGRLPLRRQRGPAAAVMGVIPGKTGLVTQCPCTTGLATVIPRKTALTAIIPHQMVTAAGSRRWDMVRIEV